jgi:hypothetical protein
MHQPAEQSLLASAHLSGIPLAFVIITENVQDAMDDEMG